MDLTPDPLLVQLRKALRAALAAAPVRSDVHGAPVIDGGAVPVLDQFGASDFERPVSAGGLDLGLTAGVVVSEELGRAACGNPYRARAMAFDVGGQESAAPAGLEGDSVVATPRAGGWELTGTALVDGSGHEPLLLAARSGERRLLVAVPATASGRTAETGCWPPAVRLDATRVTNADVVAELDDSLTGPLARARLRQAAYLLGVADGALLVAVRYTAGRRQFDTRLRDLPAVAFPLARAAVATRATRAAVYRGAWLIDSGHVKGSTAPIVALAMAAETARDVVQLCVQSCGVRALTSELGLHRYFRLAAAEFSRYGEPAALWRQAGAARLDEVRRTVSGA